MPASHSITIELKRLQHGENDALQVIWDRYGECLLAAARRALGSAPRRAGDEEDVVEGALVSFWQRATAGQFPLLQNRRNLWPLLKLIVQRKACDYRSRERRMKRGGGAQRGESIFQTVGTGRQDGLDRVAAGGDSPSRIVRAGEEAARLLKMLNDDVLQQIAVMKMEGYSNQEIAQQLACARSTVVRKLDLIRRIWMQELA